MRDHVSPTIVNRTPEPRSRRGRPLQQRARFTAARRPQTRALHLEARRSPVRPVAFDRSLRSGNLEPERADRDHYVGLRIAWPPFRRAFRAIEILCVHRFGVVVKRRNADERHANDDGRGTFFRLTTSCRAAFARPVWSPPRPVERRVRPRFGNAHVDRHLRTMGSLQLACVWLNKSRRTRRRSYCFLQKR